MKFKVQLKKYGVVEPAWVDGTDGMDEMKHFIKYGQWKDIELLYIIGQKARLKKQRQ